MYQAKVFRVEVTQVAPQYNYEEPNSQAWRNPHGDFNVYHEVTAVDKRSRKAVHEGAWTCHSMARENGLWFVGAAMPDA